MSSTGYPGTISISVGIAWNPDLVWRGDDPLDAEPLVRERYASCTGDSLEQGLRPQVLEQDECRRHVLRQGLGDPEKIVLVEEVAVGELGRASIAPRLIPSGPSAAKPDNAPMKEPKETASSQSRSVAVVTLMPPSESLRTKSMSTIRTIFLRFKRSSSGRISPLK